MSCTFKHQTNTVSKWLLKLKVLFIPLLFIFSVQTFSQGYTTIDFHQAQNDRGGAKTYVIDWVNGILNSTHTDYWEGIGVPQRVVMTGILPNNANANPNKHSLRFQILAEKGDKHAYDFPISWDQAFKTAIDIGNSVNELQSLFTQQCDPAFSAQGAAACGTLSAVTGNKVQTASFPDVIGNPGKPTLGAPNVDNRINCFETYVKFGEATPRYGDRTIEIRGNQDISNVSVTFNGYKGSGKDLAEYTLLWESSSDMVMIRFATRLASGLGTCGYGSGQGAGSISGGPYHVTLERLDDRDNKAGISLGSQDNQIMSNAVQIPPPQCGLSAGSSGCTNTATSFTVNYTSSDAAGATVLFYFTANTAGAKLPNGTTAVGSCASNNYSVVADGGGSASITITPSGTAFTAGSFRVGACVTGGGGSTTCEQPSATTIDEASVVAKVDGNTTTAASPFSLNTNQANPTAALTSLATLNGVQNNALFTSFTWAVPVIAGNNATTSNLSATNLADVTFTPTAAANPPGGFVSGLYAFEVTAVSTANGCIAKDTVYIDASGTATCPGITGPGAACENQSGLTYTAGAASPGAFLTYVWSLNPANGATITSATEGVDNISVTAGTGNFTVVLQIRADNGQIFSFEDCEKDVTVTPAPTVTTVYNPPGCSEKTFTVDVTPGTTKGGYTYSIDQPDNDIDFSAQDQTPANDGDPVHFTGLTAGDGFVVTVNANVPGSTCTGTSDCSSSTNSCSGTAERGVKAPVTSTNISTPKTEETTYKLVLESSTKVNATPNPFTEKVRFDLVSGLSGYGSLELYNTLGQKVGVVYQGYIQAGRPFVREYSITKGSKSTLIYVFKVGDQKVTGKLIGLK